MNPNPSPNPNPNSSPNPSPDPNQVGRRALRNTCLGYLSKLGDDAAQALCLAQFKSASCMVAPTRTRTRNPTRTRTTQNGGDDNPVSKILLMAVLPPFTFTLTLTLTLTLT